ncbi:hypothetical protein ARMGADRAFT_1021346 [Armillaria gallica]|uniref:Uncharacterized protein n=1 Tax=Armillaria gallica TaxID=47427 RepID=A0A2H3CSR4_ARMGA|nr:hypothetical protein ARMGADRAFT_1021346 [Armillaria gallica]
MANPDKMIRLDGTKVTTPRQPLWKTKIITLFLTLKTDPMLDTSTPSRIQGLRRRHLQHPCPGSNNVCYWISQIIGSILIGLLLD